MSDYKYGFWFQAFSYCRRELRYHVLRQESVSVGHGTRILRYARIMTHLTRVLIHVALS